MTSIGLYTSCILLAGISPVGLCEEDRRTVEDKAKDSGTKALAAGELVPGPFQLLFPALRSSHELFQRPSPQKQFLSSKIVP
jgi:hypothetical protein